MIPKKYKLGQLITIDGHVYRVKKENENGWCKNCAFNDVHCEDMFPNCSAKIGPSNYLELVK